MLLVSGQLQLVPGEGSLVRHRDILVNLAGKSHQASSHRSIYLCVLSVDLSAAAFDLPDFTTVIGVPRCEHGTQSSAGPFNNPFVIDQAGHCLIGDEANSFSWRDECESFGSGLRPENPVPPKLRKP